MQRALGSKVHQDLGGEHSLNFAGVELGGTKCVAMLARGPDGILAREAVPTTMPAETLAAIGALLAKWQSGQGFQSLGIASFGPADLDEGSPTHGYITTTPKPGWSDTDILGPLRRAAGVPTAFDTDVNGAALAEMRWGSGRGFDDFAYVTVGTGVGVGLIVNGAPTGGFAHCELGHIRPTRLPGDIFPGCCPFHGDCVEGLASGRSLIARVGAEQVADLAPGDPVWDSVAWAIAQLCHTIVCAAAPRAIAIGGGVVDKQPHLLDRVDRMLADSLAGYMPFPEGGSYVRPPELGANAGPLGAIALAMKARL
jgi:fructokinase